MKILFVTTKSPSCQGDLLELSILNGLRSVLGSNCIDYPKKKIMYHDFSESPKNTLHGKGFTLLTHKIADLSQDQRVICDIDAILYGCGHMYGEGRIPELEKYCDFVKLIRYDDITLDEFEIICEVSFSDISNFSDLKSSKFIKDNQISISLIDSSGIV